MKEKPPILNITLAEADKCRGWESDRKRFIDWKLECQRDNDVAYYEPIIQQAKAEVEREIFEEIGKSASHLQEPVEVAFYFYKKDWQSLKDKWLKGSNENQTS